MAPRRTEREKPPATATGMQPGPGQDRKRDLEDRKHHPAKAAKPRASHKPQKKPRLPPRHATHAHPHGEDTGPHANKPSPIKPAKKITRTGAKKS